MHFYIKIYALKKCCMHFMITINMEEPVKKILILAALLAASSCSVMETENVQVNDMTAPATVATGRVHFTVLGDYVENGTLKSYPISQCGIYNGYYGAGSNVGYTDNAGKATVTLPAGTINVSFFKMTSSHSALFEYRKVNVVAGKTVTNKINLCPTQVTIIAHYRTPYGKALYLTGQTSWLGNWSTATKMSYREINGDAQWVITKNLPIGAQYKIVMADWISGETRSTTGVTWMKGNNAVIAAPSTSYESVNNVWPQF